MEKFSSNFSKFYRQIFRCAKYNFFPNHYSFKDASFLQIKQISSRRLINYIMAFPVTFDCIMFVWIFQGMAN